MTVQTQQNLLLRSLRDRIAGGLLSKTITTASKWAENYRVMGPPYAGNWSFKRHPWSREMHDCEAEQIIGQKAAQMAYTETALNKTFSTIDLQGISVLYVLPASNPDAGDFSSARFDPALELSSHLSNLFSEVKNVGHKRAGTANLYIRGSRSRSQLKSLPAGLVILDEVDEMLQANVPLAFERMSGHEKKQSFLLSTPTIEGHGINGYFDASSQDHFHFKCPHCSRWTELTEECLIITAESLRDHDKIMDSYVECKECNTELKHELKHEWLAEDNVKWVSSFSNRVSRGFHVPQFYSFAMRPHELAISKLKGFTNPADEQEFYNSKLGLPHTPEGSQVSDKDIDECTKNYDVLLHAPTSGSPIITMGVDVGKWLHWEVDQWFLDAENHNGLDINIMAMPRVVAMGKCLHFEELDKLLYQYQVKFCIIDAHPEKRKALEFAQRFPNHVKLNYYVRGLTGKQLNVHNEEEYTVSSDRSSWMDLSLGRFHQRRIELPRNTSFEYKQHIKEPVKIYKKDADGNPHAVYINNKDDHFAHARNYAEIALPFAATFGGNQDVSNIY